VGKSRIQDSGAKPGVRSQNEDDLLSAFCLLFLPSCGYHVAGQAKRIPPDVKTIAVPAFKNLSPTFRIEQQVTTAVTHELIQRTHYNIVAKPDEADAVLTGTI